jgi:hypothetical protein
VTQLETVKLTVAKICHEIANCLIVIKFLQEDLSNSPIREIGELCREIDILINITDFFRNIYSMSDATSDSVSPIMNTLKLKKITLCDKTGIIEKLSSSGGKTICGVVYMMMKSCKPGDSIIVEKRGENTIMISIDKPRTIATKIIDTLNAKGLVNEDVFNVFAVYVKSLAEVEGLNISVNIDKNHTPSIEIWKK